MENSKEVLTDLFCNKIPKMNKEIVKDFNKEESLKNKENE